MPRTHHALFALLMIAPLLLPVAGGSAPEGSSREVFANVLYVSPTSSTYPTIQEAILQAHEGDTIYVAPGLYLDGISIDKDHMTIIGNSTEGDVNVLFPQTESVVNIIANFTTLRGLNISSEDSMDTVSLMNCNNITMEDISIWSDGGTGLSAVNVTDLSIKGIDLHMVGESALSFLYLCNRLTIEDFRISMEQFVDAVVTVDRVHGVMFENGSIKSDGSLYNAFHFMEDSDVVLLNVSAEYSDNFIYLDVGHVWTFDCIFPADDVWIPAQQWYSTVEVYLKRPMTAYAKWPDGSWVPAEGAELEIMTDGAPEYLTEHYGGGSSKADASGAFAEVPYLFARNYSGGAPARFHTSTVKSHFTADKAQEVDLGVIDVNDTSALEIFFDDVHSLNGTLTGHVTYLDGPKAGIPVRTANVVLVNISEALSWTNLTDEYGTFNLFDVPLCSNLTLTVSPDNWTEGGSKVSGYLNLTTEIIMTDDMTLNLDIEHYEYVPTTASISGMITYLDGPKAGQNATGAVVRIWNETGSELFVAMIGPSGSYLASDLPLGSNYTFRAFPYGNDTDGDFISGYLDYERTFDLTTDMVLDAAFGYLEPSRGPVFGIVKYLGGPKDGAGCPNATVEVLNGTLSLGTTLTNDTGHFRFGWIVFGKNYSMRVTPNLTDLGENNIRTGYLVWRSSGFDHMNETEFNVSLNYYEFEEPPVEHPRVVIRDEDGGPISGVKVTMTVGNDTYEAYTDATGAAVFTDLIGFEFPDGAKFRAEKDGYRSVEWEEGEPVPKMPREDEGGDDLVLVLILIGVVILVVAGAVLLTASSKKKQQYEE